MMILTTTKFTESDRLADNLIDILTRPESEDLERLESHVKMLPNLARGEDAVRSARHLYESGYLTKRFDALTSQLTREQAQAIHHFLEYMREAHSEDFVSGEPDTALRRYWSAAVGRF